MERGRGAKRLAPFPTCEFLSDGIVLPADGFADARQVMPTMS